MCEILEVLYKASNRPLLNGGSRVYRDIQGTWMEYTSGLGQGKIWNDGIYQRIKDTELLIYRWAPKPEPLIEVVHDEICKHARKHINKPAADSTIEDLVSYYEAVGNFYGYFILDNYPNLFRISQVKEAWV